MLVYLSWSDFTPIGLSFPMAKARIPLPNAKDALGVLNLAAAVATAVKAKGAASLITGELATELQAVAARIPGAIKAHNDAKEMEKQLEKLYQDRDAIVQEALPLVQRGSKVLQGSLGADRLRDMGPYGYTVDDTPREAKAPKG
jgi:hypothetical protein